MRSWGLGLLFSLALAAPGVAAPPLSGLPVVAVSDADGDGDFDQADIDAALVVCSPGCNLRFLARTYRDVAMDIGAFPDGFAMYGRGPGRTVLQQPLFESAEDWDAIVEVTAAAPDGLVIQDLTLDGRKESQRPPLRKGALDAAVGRGNGIQTNNSVAHPVREGVIRNVEARGFVHGGILLGDAPGWLVEANWVRHIGCHQVDEPCGNALPENPWDRLPDSASSVRGAKAPGYGIVVQAGSSGARVAGNDVHHIAKIGIEVYVPGAHACDAPLTPRDVVIENNTVWQSQSGFVNNGGCATTFSGNLALGMRASGGSDRYVGHGFRCAKGGTDSLWLGNIAIANQGSGFALRCTGGDFLARGNISFNNCLGSRVALADLDLRGPELEEEAWVGGVAVESHRSFGTRCDYGVWVQGRSGVRIAGGEIEGGREGGMWLRAVSGVEIDGLRLFSSRPPRGGDVGVTFDHREPLRDIRWGGGTAIERFAYSHRLYFGPASENR